ncbi:MAG: hypothetical protein A2W52_00190 [Candidatus Taylorbacteria bacterium RIFCSPHIGHO2_02_49_25]|uniref:VTT domain-containing protein n=1 Tax=Candidatus Taylorbacteria bacterium RIFCSPHIGHO2_02_49_25 TaxID=1802305 RepID=A0A1G2MGW6_9BACT|nr:MAG: hypothetical protein A2W52_00190 [Candidatus Taylorbacteria bacterium RIFCSPHIGHO2_02_49_25]OHA35504.1 MAG: hypothetical protein A3B27_00295 [Candidatus Taylorbacteria bacterium RIFCSPLOWO2_01_FULL_50_130]OHA35586.1 MAG: hypothetical protein A2W65_00820 [Candidatus Taylorbacteria bacterium RIFCSPLOWO2_02_50_13]OHA40825.1 MAG: hypothetical protein A3H73_00495 [Candidatus Taylorbacteria bacterium RIFCSPLOWO2_02_FULL_50_120]OHA47207.1 MAG: hypothetical protein A3G61_00255 [Candidatus Taylo
MHIGTTTLAILFAYKFPALFFGGFFLGETVIIPAAFLAGQNILSLSEVFWLTFLGTVSADVLWFLVGPFLWKVAHRFETISTKSEAVLKRLDELYANQPFRALLVSKFVFGTRFLTVIYLSFERVSALRFLVMNFLSTLLWLTTIAALGWLAGESIINLLPIISDVKYAFLFIVLLVIALKLAPIWFQKKIMHEKPPL